MDRDSLPYRPCVGIMLINRDGKVFIGNRISSKDGDAWQMPQGGIDAGEDPLSAALRELQEETNVTSVALLAEAPDWYNYDIPDDLATGRFQRKWRGQTQKWFAFRFIGPESEIDIARPMNGAHPAEFGSWRWEDISALPALIVEFKRPVYDKVCTVFAPMAVAT